jgi:hypothetical protein
MKKCPHCHAETFGVLQLFALDSFSPTECRKCKQLVRNDGLRQFLGVIGILGVIPISIPLFSLVPEQLEPLAVLLLLVLIATPMVLLTKPVKFGYNVTLPPFSPDLQNDKVIRVSGWSEPELRQLLADFVAENSSGWPFEKFELQKEDKDCFQLTFPEDIHPFLFAALVNYALYPMDLEFTDRKIVAVGRTTLNATFDGVPEELVGHKAILYVPENDEEYDVVHLQSETGINFAMSLGEDRWRKIDDARLPNEVKKLSLIGGRE